MYIYIYIFIYIGFLKAQKVPGSCPQQHVGSIFRAFGCLWASFGHHCVGPQHLPTWGPPGSQLLGPHRTRLRRWCSARSRTSCGSLPEGECFVPIKENTAPSERECLAVQESECLVVPGVECLMVPEADCLVVPEPECILQAAESIRIWCTMWDLSMILPQFHSEFRCGDVWHQMPDA